MRLEAMHRRIGQWSPPAARSPTPANSTPRGAAFEWAGSAPPICRASGAASTSGAEQRQDFGGAALRQRHVQQSEQQHDAHRRQSDAAIQRQPDAEQQADLERAEAAEIGRPPFHDQRQCGAEAENFLRRQQRIPAIGRATARQQRREAERRPAQHQRFCAPAPPRSPPHRARSARPAPGQRQSRHADWPTAPSAAAARTTARRAGPPPRSCRRPTPPSPAAPAHAAAPADAAPSAPAPRR